MAVTMPAPARRQHDIAGFHQGLFAIDGRKRALGVEDDPEGVRRVAVRARFLAGQDHLVGADQRAGGGDIVARDRVAHDQIAALGQFRIDQAAGGIERLFALAVAPLDGLEGRGRFGIEDRLIAWNPARRHIHGSEMAVEIFERIDVCYGLPRRHGPDSLRKNETDWSSHYRRVWKGLDREDRVDGRCNGLCRRGRRAPLGRHCKIEPGGRVLFFRGSTPCKVEN